MKTLAPYQIPIFILALLGFCWMALASRHHEPNYTMSEIQGMDRLMARVTASPSTFSHRQAAALSEIYGITAEEAAKPVLLWR